MASGSLIKSRRGEISRCLGQLHDLGDAGLDVLVDLVDVGIGSHTGLNELLAEQQDAVVLLPGLDLLLGAVGVLVGGGVAAQTIGQHVQQHGALVLLDKLQLAAIGVDNGQGVHAVHALGIHLVLGDAGAHPGQLAIGQVSPLVRPPMP